jgi:hypothetical protein
MVKSVNNTENEPQYLNQNNNQKKLNISIQISDTLCYGGSGVLKPHLPCYWSICISNKKLIPNHLKLLDYSLLDCSRGLLLA